MSSFRRASLVNGKPSRSQSLASRTHYSELTDQDAEEMRTDRPRQRTSRMPRWFIIVVAVIALLLIIPGSKLYRDNFDGLALFGEDLTKDPSKHLIIASYTGQNVSWLDQVPSDWTPKQYFLDDPNPPNGLSVPRNQGREAMAYLTYIIDHYDNLPAFMVFVHGHYRSWHQVEPLPLKIRALNLTALSKEHYISLRCGDQMGCERVPYVDTLNVNWPGEEGMREFWKTIVPSEDLPRNISYKCCAQHAVTRTAVRRRSKEDWVRVRAPLIGELDQLDMIPKVSFTPQWIVGAWYEKFWHVLFGVGGEYCPSVEYCNQVHFSNAIACDQGTDFHMDDGNAWEDTVCVSAFDGLAPDEPANLTAFDIIDAGAKLHRARRDRKFHALLAEQQQIASLQAALADATGTAKPSATAKTGSGKEKERPKGALAQDMEKAEEGAGRWADDAKEPVRAKPGEKARTGVDLKALAEEAEGAGYSGSGGSGYTADMKEKLPPRYEHRR